MDIEEFYKKYNGQEKPIESVVKGWDDQEVDSILDDLAFGSAIFLDALNGDGVSDRISPELLDVLNQVYTDKDINTYGEARTLLKEFLEKDDDQVRGFISMVKGRIAENKFVEVTEGKVRLAQAANQKGWDASILRDDYIQYIQVKAYSDPYDVIKKMKKVNKQVLQGELVGENGEVIDKVDFAIPHDLVEKVSILQENNEEIAHIELISLPITAKQAGDIVAEGLSNLGDGAIAHLFNELLSGLLLPTAIVASINAYHVINNQKKVHEGVVDSVGSMSLTGVGYTSALITEVVLENMLDTMLSTVSFGVGVSTRIILKRAVKARLQSAISIQKQIDSLRLQHRNLNFS